MACAGGAAAVCPLSAGGGANEKLGASGRERLLSGGLVEVGRAPAGGATSGLVGEAALDPFFVGAGAFRRLPQS